MAKDSVRLVAERGSTLLYIGEFSINADEILSTDLGTTLDVPVGTESQTMGVLLDAAHPYCSAITMIAPSPDWISGFYNVLPVSEDGKWWKSFRIDTQPFDAGTDSGTTYDAEDSVSDPREVVREITASSGLFVKDGAVAPVAYWTFELEDPVPV